MLYLQIAAAVVSILLGLAQMTKESQPLVEKYQENRQQALLKQQQEEAVHKATRISQMAIQWQYRGNDGTWRYYCDPTGRFWCRVNIQGTQEYCESPIYTAQTHTAMR